MKAFNKLLNLLNNLPMIGPKSAERIVFYIINNMTANEARALASAIIEVKDKIKNCKICNVMIEDNICRFCCSDLERRKVICVVERQEDVFALERTGVFKGVYHVLGGLLSPLDGIVPDDLKIKELIERIKKESPEEVILCMSTTTEGEATLLYLLKLLKNFKNIKISRLPYGLSYGTELQNIDTPTLSQAIQSRSVIN